jgi:drug/metabolite transporter (DMT)-like permease
MTAPSSTAFSTCDFCDMHKGDDSGTFRVLLPVSAALVGVLVLGESFSGLQLLAFGIALASMLLATLPTRAALRVGRRADSGQQ